MAKRRINEIDKLRGEFQKLEEDMQNYLKAMKKLHPADEAMKHITGINEMYQQILAQKTVLTELRFMLRDDPRQGEYLAKAVRAMDYMNYKWWVNMLSTPLTEVMKELDYFDGIHGHE